MNCYRNGELVYMYLNYGKRIKPPLFPLFKENIELGNSVWYEAYMTPATTYYNFPNLKNKSKYNFMLRFGYRSNGHYYEIFNEFKTYCIYGGYFDPPELKGLLVVFEGV